MNRPYTQIQQEIMTKRNKFWLVGDLREAMLSHKDAPNKSINHASIERNIRSCRTKGLAVDKKQTGPNTWVYRVRKVS